jgi:hypothetical protein
MHLQHTHCTNMHSRRARARELKEERGDGGSGKERGW